MNYRGSYRKLLANSRSAMVAAIEIYNKPRFDYREEVFVQLLINAWELLLKAMVSKSKRSIYYPKKKGEPYRTLSWSHAFSRSKPLWPKEIAANAVVANLELIGVYRDNSVHFYNAHGFEVVIYSLAQTAITNYCDLARAVFGKDLADEVTWSLLPLGVRAPIGPMEYLSGARPPGTANSDAVDEFLKKIESAAADLADEEADTGRLLTIFDVSLQSTKKIDKADIVVGVDHEVNNEPFLVMKTLDPNKSHPLRRKDALEKIGDGSGGHFNQYSFDAVAWHLGLREKKHLCWTDDATGTKKWSLEVVAIMKRLTSEEINQARTAYSNRGKGQANATSSVA
jgi:hypothetical protein